MVRTSLLMDECRRRRSQAGRTLFTGSSDAPPPNRLRLRVKVRLAADDPHVATVCDVWPAANWLEREVWDLFGIVFEGHGDLRRLLMPEDWEGHPLRKDFPVQIRLKPKSSEPLQVTEEQFRKNLQADRAARK